MGSMAVEPQLATVLTEGREGSLAARVVLLDKGIEQFTGDGPGSSLDRLLVRVVELAQPTLHLLAELGEVVGQEPLGLLPEGALTLDTLGEEGEGQGRGVDGGRETPRVRHSRHPSGHGVMGACERGAGGPPSGGH